MPAFNKKIAETQCVNCGQCRAFCPTGAISIHTNTDKVFKALADPDIREFDLQHEQLLMDAERWTEEVCKACGVC